MGDGFGPTLRRLRQDARLTQHELAKKARVSLSTVQNVEAGKRPTMHWSNYRAIAKALGMTVEQLDAAWRGDVRRMTIELPAEVAKKLEKVAKVHRRSAEQLMADLIEAFMRPSPPPLEEELKVKRKK